MGLGFILKRKFDGWDEKTDRHPHIPDLDNDQWGSLFFDVLNCPEADQYIPGEDLNKYTERFRRKFQQHLSALPMLGRMWEFYNDAWYAPEEIAQLRLECLRVQTSTSNPIALEGLGLIIRGCNEASADGLGLFLAAD